ncbi:response regulator [Thiohalobacter sp. COW1]|uniref:Response regulator receiver n=1 Tax=Thiohalobacter thiocyanaticus TaxID=585455 RepID=A0A1Z4VQM7_9GAMM|nr:MULTISPECIES: response regulator [Thiohalobacter]BAZ93936.1 response regulator receiver [Thiohalobacter thiocyanaticus]BCO30996.1 response regulator [Thiohalobacter sp. COW1]
MDPQSLQRILYVEDEPDIQAVARLALEQVGGFQVEVCSSGDEALARAAAWGPDLILLDVMLPGMDGPETLRRLREQPDTRDIPVAFMTARVQARELEHYRSLGAIGLLPKPFDPMTLADQLRTLWIEA